jgi:NitT/TauT family transport system ATP-binding protein
VTHAPGAAVSSEGVGKTFDDGTVALHDFDLDVPSGRFVSLVGPSGCGKSTFLRLVAGLSPVTAGRLTVDGMEPRQARAQQHRLAYVLQDPTLLRWRRVRDNVALPLELDGVPAAQIRERVEESLAVVGLADVGHMFPDQLSGGMRMRVSIARALALEPTLLLMDEPFGALDEITRQRLNDELLDLWRARRFTCLFVTHSVLEATYLSERVVVLGPRPARIVAARDVPFDERTPALRTDTAFADLVARLSGDLSRAIEGDR